MSDKVKIPVHLVGRYDYLEEFCNRAGVDLTICSPYHWKIIGDYEVNYYPTTQKVYIQKTNKSYNEENLEKVVDASINFSDKITTANNRKSNKSTLNRLWEKGDRTCKICGEEIESREDASVDHHIPFSKGGSDRADNKVLSHEWCNHEKDDKLPTEINYGLNSKEDNIETTVEWYKKIYQTEEDKKFWDFKSIELFDINLRLNSKYYPYLQWYLTGTFYQEPERFGLSLGINTSEYPLLYMQLLFWSLELTIEKRDNNE